MESQARTSTALLRILALAIFAAYLAFTGPIYAAGTFAEGKAIVQVKSLERRGVFVESWEGELVWAAYNEGEECSENDYQCFTPENDTIEFSARPDNQTLSDFLRNNLGKEMLIEYRIHRWEAMGLESDFEITAARVWRDQHVDQLPVQHSVSRTGSKRDFFVFGRILRFEEQGTMVGTYEGLYYDKQRRKVHPFSVTDDSMAEYIRKAMEARTFYYIGISEAYVSGFRNSSLDIYEINYQRAPE